MGGMRGEFKWWVPRGIRKRILLAKCSKGDLTGTWYTCSPAAWAYSQYHARRTVMRGYEPIWKEVATGKFTVTKSGYEYHS